MAKKQRNQRNGNENRICYGIWNRMGYITNITSTRWYYNVIWGMGQPAHSRNPYEYINPYSWIDPSPSMATQSISWPGVWAHGSLLQQTVGSNQISMDRIESISQGLLNRSPEINISRYPPPNQGVVAFSGWWLSIWPRVKRKHLEGVYVLLESILLMFGMSLEYRACDPYHRDDLQQGCSQPPATTGDSGLLSAVYKLFISIHQNIDK